MFIPSSLEKPCSYFKPQASKTGEGIMEEWQAFRRHSSHPKKRRKKNESGNECRKRGSFKSYISTFRSKFLSRRASSSSFTWLVILGFRFEHSLKNKEGNSLLLVSFQNKSIFSSPYTLLSLCFALLMLCSPHGMSSKWLHNEIPMITSVSLCFSHSWSPLKHPGHPYRLTLLFGFLFRTDIKSRSSLMRILLQSLS